MEVVDALLKVSDPIHANATRVASSYNSFSGLWMQSSTMAIWMVRHIRARKYADLKCQLEGTKLHSALLCSLRLRHPLALAPTKGVHHPRSVPAAYQFLLQFPADKGDG
ncbi:hypothetical protein CPC08DRAFT_716813 [Agrocybe pediades]|nr:hypothetical protein CPC08DRAFT_716813 [Agrocybe pediades]